MQITIESPHIKANNTILESAKTKLAHLEKIFDRITYCEVIMKKERDHEGKSCIMEIKLEVPGKTLFAKQNAETFETALDESVEVMRRQLEKYKLHLEHK